MKNNWWRTSNNDSDGILLDDVDWWMPIPSFDNILESNRDVLERIKEKGD